MAKLSFKKGTYLVVYHYDCEFVDEIKSNHGDYVFTYEDVKRLVESHEIIQKDFESVEVAGYEHMISGYYSDPYWIRVKQAINDVRRCQ